MSEEINMDSNKDSFYADKLQKSYNYGAKVYINGNNDPADTPEKMKARLRDYMKALKEEYDQPISVQNIGKE